MKKLEQHFKKQRNDIDTQIKKYKKDLDVIGIRYDHKSAHVEVPNHVLPAGLNILNGIGWQALRESFRNSTNI